jgi:putative ABC transport system ATP-binding protein
LDKKDNNFLYELENISFVYQLKSIEVNALKDISMKIPKKALITLSGPSGSGKSTLINLLGLIEPNQTGGLLFQGEELSKISDARKNEIRKTQIGFIFQQFHLIPVLSAEENVSYFLNRLKLSKEEIRQRTEKTLESVGLIEHKTKKPSELSGGQQQRVAIARAIAKNPSVIIADEPTANLDQKTGREIMEIFKKLCKEENVTVIITSHDPMVLAYSEHNFYIKDGKLEKGSQ